MLTRRSSQAALRVVVFALAPATLVACSGSPTQSYVAGAYDAGYDARTGYDAGVGYDAGPGYDAGRGYDAGQGYDAGTRYDAGTGYDGGTCAGYDAPDPNALIWSRRGGWPLWDWCQCQPDSAVLPPDPRTYVQEGVDNGRAVAFNIQWKDCHVDPVAVQERGHVRTCGELRASFARGEALMTPSSIGAGALFSGTEYRDVTSGFGIATFPASSYNDVWRSWGAGFTQRPDNFDELVSERYGAPFGNTHNPYPLPGEDPNATNGGSGRLPMFFTQLREPDGRWTGQVGITCQGCHSGSVGSASDGPGLGFLPGSGSPLAEHNLFLRDMLPQGYPASVVTILNLNKVRGINNASDVNLAFIFPDDGIYDLGAAVDLITSGSTAGLDTPAWWNMGHRPAKFIDGTFPMDAPRVDMVFYTPILGLFGSVLGPLSESGQTWMRDHGPDANDWISSLKSPAYPYAVDRSLAEQGSVMFHTLDLWSPSRNNPIRRPEEGNGSCASCHGAYAPRYFNDPAYVARPELEGMAGYITPIDIIGTDRVRLDAMSGQVQEAGATNFFGYPPTAGTANDCGPQNQDRLRGSREMGYLAQPLYGIWATAPYLHNGSVPNLWQILQPSARPELFRRFSTPARADQAGRVLMGYDTNLARAFDPVNVGWRYDSIACGSRQWWQPPLSDYVNCAEQPIADFLNGNLILAWNLLTVPSYVTPSQMEERKIYNSHMYGQGNQGHAFTSVLTDAERRAILEYLKTL